MKTVREWVREEGAWLETLDPDDPRWQAATRVVKQWAQKKARSLVGYVPQFMWEDEEFVGHVLYSGDMLGTEANLLSMWALHEMLIEAGWQVTRTEVVKQYVRRDPLVMGFLQDHIEEHSRRSWPSYLIKAPAPAPLELYRAATEERFLYAFSHSGRVKLGRTKSPKQRMKDLQRGAGGTGEVLMLVPETVCSEQDAHKRWAAQRITGEWFTLTPELSAWCASTAASAAP